jgi:hypothetical protein
MGKATPRQLYPPVKNPGTNLRMLEGPQDRSVPVMKKNHLATPGVEPRTVQPVTTVLSMLFTNIN